VVQAEQQLEPRRFNSEQQTPIFYEGHIYGVRKRGGQLVCLDAEGQQLWHSGSDRFGHGPYLIADAALFVLDDSGWLTAADATSEGYRRWGRCEVFAEGHDAWGPMAMVGGRLVLRDLTRMSCLDLNQK
jgi:outer membrane protein assembly factor BamB